MNFRYLLLFLHRRVIDGEGSMYHLGHVIKEVGALEEAISSLITKEIDSWKIEDDISKGPLLGR